jgi:hypothetical protein
MSVSINVTRQNTRPVKWCRESYIDRYVPFVRITTEINKSRYYTSNLYDINISFIGLKGQYMSLCIFSSSKNAHKKKQKQYQP